MIQGSAMRVLRRCSSQLLKASVLTAPLIGEGEMRGESVGSQGSGGE